MSIKMNISSLIHVGFTNEDQIDCAKIISGVFYNNSDNGRNIPLYMLDAHSLRAINSEVVNTHEKMQNRINELDKTIAEMKLAGDILADMNEARVKTFASSAAAKNWDELTKKIERGD